MKLFAKRIAAGLLSGVFAVAAWTPPAAAAPRRFHLPFGQRHRANPFAAWNDGDAVQMEQIERAVRVKMPPNATGKFDEDDYAGYFAKHPDDPYAAAFHRAVGGGIEFSNNCYSFAVNDPGGHQPFAKPVPGGAAGIFANPSRLSDGAYVAHMAEQDTIRPLPPGQPVPPGMYRIALVTAPGVEFHWYRQGPDGLWYSKRGHDPVTNRDASGHLIRDPRRADRDYHDGGKRVNYTNFIGFFAVPDDGITLDTPASRNQHIDGYTPDPNWLEKLLAVASQSPWSPPAP